MCMFTLHVCRHKLKHRKHASFCHFRDFSKRSCRAGSTASLSITTVGGKKIKPGHLGAGFPDSPSFDGDLINSKSRRSCTSRNVLAAGTSNGHS